MAVLVLYEGDMLIANNNNKKLKEMKEKWEKVFNVSEICKKAFNG